MCAYVCLGVGGIKTKYKPQRYFWLFIKYKGHIYFLHLLKNYCDFLPTLFFTNNIYNLLTLSSHLNSHLPPKKEQNFQVPHEISISSFSHIILNLALLYVRVCYCQLNNLRNVGFFSLLHPSNSQETVLASKIIWCYSSEEKTLPVVSR